MTPTEILCQLISIPSVNPMGRDVVGDIYFESRLSDWLESYFQKLGASYERIDVAPGRSNMIAIYEGDRSGKAILLDAHQDTVPVDGMTIEPFEPRMDGGRIYGRGSCDVKGGMAAMLHAFGRLFKEEASCAGDVILSCSCDEEATTLGVQDLVRYWQAPGRSKILAARPTCAVVAEPTDLNAVVAHRGVVRFRVHTHGIAVHSSEPSQGKSAIYSMARVVSRLEQLASELGHETQPHPLCGGATLSVGRIDGGTSVNIVPAHCQIEIDRRVIPSEALESVWPSLTETLSEIDDDVVCEPPWISTPALGDDDNHWVADAILKCMNDVTSRRQSIGVPYCTHASTISAAGVPSIVFGPGSIAQAHTKDEYIEIESLEAAAETYFRFCCDQAVFDNAE